MKRLVVIGLGLIIASCGANAGKQAVEKNPYSLLDEIYAKPDKQIEKLVRDIQEKDGKVLRVPKYIKVYRGSYRDDKGNVVSGGFEYIRVDDGNPDTNF